MSDYMTPSQSDFSLSPTDSSNRRKFLRLFGGASLALAGAAIAGCANMAAGPKQKRPKSYINGRGNGPSNMGGNPK